MTLIDWLSLYALPDEPLDYEEAIELIVRKFEELAKDLAYLWWAIAKFPQEVLWLSGRICRLNDLFPPRSMCWQEWIEVLDVVP